MPRNNIKDKTAALYMRLSKEDAESGISASVENQKKLLRRFAEENSFLVYDEYTDDGWTGTNMERPDFCRLKKDIEEGKIGVVITKDFSRLGRNTGQVMTMLDDFFVKHDVRYISITEGIDTKCGGTSAMLAPMFGFVSEMYSGDTSRKINAAFSAKMHSGECIAPRAPYGYKKDPQNKNHLIPDPCTAGNVKKIFMLAKNGYSPGKISDILNRGSVPSPSEYRNGSYSKGWSRTTIGKILRNEVYLGHMLQGKSHKPSFKSNIIKTVPKADWIRVENTHTPLIDAETWNIVRQNVQSRVHIREKGFCNIFSGIAKCADCGRNMSSVATRKKGSDANLCCGGYKQRGTSICTNHAIDYNALYNVVLGILRDHIKFSEQERLALLAEMLKSAASDPQKTAGAKSKLEIIRKKLACLYDDKYSGKIDASGFEILLKQYEHEKQFYESIVFEEEHTTQDTSHENYLALISEYTDLNLLTRQLTARLIERIDVHQGIYKDKVKYQKLDICFRFACKSQTITVTPQQS